MRNALDRFIAEPAYRLRAEELAVDFRMMDTPHEIMAVVAKTTS